MDHTNSDTLSWASKLEHLEGKESPPQRKASIMELYSFADWRYKTLAVIGIITAIIGGLATPCTQLVMREVLNEVDHSRQRQDVGGKTSFIPEALARALLVGLPT